MESSSVLERVVQAANVLAEQGKKRFTLMGLSKAAELPIDMTRQAAKEAVLNNFLAKTKQGTRGGKHRTYFMLAGGDQTPAAMMREAAGQAVSPMKTLRQLAEDLYQRKERTCWCGPTAEKAKMVFASHVARMVSFFGDVSPTDMTKEKWDAFETHLEGLGFTENTIRIYRARLNNLLVEAEGQGIEVVNFLGMKVADRYTGSVKPHSKAVLKKAYARVPKQTQLGVESDEVQEKSGTSPSEVRESEGEPSSGGSEKTSTTPSPNPLAKALPKASPREAPTVEANPGPKSQTQFRQIVQDIRVIKNNGLVQVIARGVFDLGPHTDMSAEEFLLIFSRDQIEVLIRELGL